LAPCSQLQNNAILSQSKPCRLADVEHLAKFEERNEIPNVSVVLRFSYKPSHLHLRILPCRVALPVAPLNLAVFCLDLLGGVDDALEVESQFLTAVEVGQIR